MPMYICIQWQLQTATSYRVCGIIQQTVAGGQHAYRNSYDSIFYFTKAGFSLCK